MWSWLCGLVCYSDTENKNRNIEQFCCMLVSSAINAFRSIKGGVSFESKEI